MSLREKFTEDMKTAMKSGEKSKLQTIRLMIAKLKEVDIEARGTGQEKAGDVEIIQMLAKMVKQRQESIDAYQKADRQDLVVIEQAEIEVISAYLPAQLSDEEVDKIIAQTIESVGATGMADMGKVVASLKQNYSGQMDFAKASQKVKQHLQKVA